MGFLVITCIEPAESFMGCSCISLRMSMLIVGFFFAACASYSLGEAEIFFKDQKYFGIINKHVIFVIQMFMAILIGLDFFIKKKGFSRLLYYLSFATAGLSLAYNTFKVSLFNDKLKDDFKIKDHKILQFLFVIRVIAEFLIQMIVCYYCYSYKKKL